MCTQAYCRAACQSETKEAVEDHTTKPNTAPTRQKHLPVRSAFPEAAFIVE